MDSSIEHKGLEGLDTQVLSVLATIIGELVDVIEISTLFHVELGEMAYSALVLDLLDKDTGVELFTVSFEDSDDFARVISSRVYTPYPEVVVLVLSSCQDNVLSESLLVSPGSKINDGSPL